MPSPSGPTGPKRRSGFACAGCPCRPGSGHEVAAGQLPSSAPEMMATFGTPALGRDLEGPRTSPRGGYETGESRSCNVDPV